jgi:hypothetical protein
MTTMVSIFDRKARVVGSPLPPPPDASSPLTHPTKAAEKPRATHKARRAFEVKFIGAKYTHYLSGGVAPTPLKGGAQRLGQKFQTALTVTASGSPNWELIRSYSARNVSPHALD